MTPLSCRGQDPPPNPGWFNAVLPEEEDRLLGCVYLDPPEDDCPPGTDVLTSWWVVDDEAGGELERALDDFVPRWLQGVWGFRQPHVDP